MIKYLIFFLSSAAISFAVTPLVRLLAKRANILDMPSERKVHQKPVPLLGGIPVFMTFNLVLLLGYVFGDANIKMFFLENWKPLLICQCIILGLGIYDDIKRLNPGIKFLIQVLSGSLLLVFGMGIYDIANPVTGSVIHLGLFSIPLTILWVVGITNALNLVDGLDGLAAGISFIVCMAIGGMAYLNQNIGIGLVALILAGTLLGFLRYNFYPAKIFMGDSGSLLLGFLLSVLSIRGASKSATLVAILAPILILGLPIMETLLSMARRFLRSTHMVDLSGNNGKFKALFFRGFSMFEADKDHIHHRLLKKGFSQRKAVLLLYGLCAGLGIFALVSVAVTDLNKTLFLAAILVAVFIGIRTLNYQEFKILESGLLLPLFNFPVLKKRAFQAFFDLLLITASFYLSFILVIKSFGGAEKSLFMEALPLVLFIKIIIFYVMGLYKGEWLYSSIEDLLLVVKSLITATLMSDILVGLIIGLRPFGGFIFFLTDFYLLGTFVLGFRISYRVVNNLYNRNAENRGKKVLIYGAGHRGSIALKEIKYNGTYFASPIGFIDDDARKRGKMIHNCPILGSIEDIEEVALRNEIEEIVVSTDKIGKDKIGKLIDFCKRKGIIMRQFEFRFYDFPELSSE